MEIKMTATKNQEGSDVFRLCTTDPVDVEVTGTRGTEQLKQMFNELLKTLLAEDVKVKFEPTAGYDNGMYENVCQEYVSILNDELVKAREKLVAEKLCE